ncbi:MAG: hypothetical protein PHF79_00830 [Candidatus Pacebacteria bacterium]|nr:hypothetical protein [Candidatus Paceibacterota bacterium]
MHFQVRFASEVGTNFLFHNKKPSAQEKRFIPVYYHQYRHETLQANMVPEDFNTYLEGLKARKSEDIPHYIKIPAFV